MCEVCENIENIITVHSVSRYDPTRTTNLRNRMVSESDRRFNQIIRLIISAVVVEDIFGLIPVETYQETPGNRAYSFLTDAEKVEEFNQWLQTQIDKHIISQRQIGKIRRFYGVEWFNKYIGDAYKRGVIRALGEIRKGGYETTPFDINSIMSEMFHKERIELLYTRVYSDLKGITGQMEQQISRVLTQGLIKGDNPKTIARKLVSVINGKGVGELGITDTIGRFIPAVRRAEILARTEIVRAHHLAMIREFRRWGIKNVFVKAEWKTAGDNRVCPACAFMEGRIFTLDEIEPMIPFHPQCRCIALPIFV